MSIAVVVLIFVNMLWSSFKVTRVEEYPNPWGRYHGGRRPSSDDSLHSPTVIPPSALDKPQRCHISGYRKIRPSHPEIRRTENFSGPESDLENSYVLCLKMRSFHYMFVFVFSLYVSTLLNEVFRSHHAESSGNFVRFLWHPWNPVSWSVTIVGEHAVTPHLVIGWRW